MCSSDLCPSVCVSGRVCPVLSGSSWPLALRVAAGGGSLWPGLGLSLGLFAPGVPGLGGWLSGLDWGGLGFSGGAWALGWLAVLPYRLPSEGDS